MNPHPSSLRLLVTAGLAWAAAAAGMAQPADILPPTRRQPAVDQAAELAEVRRLDPLPENLNNPFFPNSMKRRPESATPAAPDAPVVHQTGPTDYYELLTTIAPQINPTGTMILRGQRLLLFGQKKIQVGDQLPITFQNQRYLLTISNIENSFFTIQLNGAEITRPIIPAN